MEMKTILKGLFALGALLILSLTFISLSAQREISDEDASRIVDALMENQEYRDYLESDDWIEPLVETMISHPTYQGLIETTPREDCVSVLLMGMAIGEMSGEDVTPLSNSQTDEFCDWYRRQVE